MRISILVIALMVAASLGSAQFDRHRPQGEQERMGVSYGGRALLKQTGTATPVATLAPAHRSSRNVPLGVLHRVPQDFASIQAAIDASSDGDTVLVSEGTYMENIRYRGKAIVVGSAYLTDADTSHIANTIIDGGSSAIADSGSVVYFVNGEDTTSVLCGFTIRGGTGTKYHLSASWGNYWARAGGGVFCDNAGARIKNNIITRNRLIASAAMGGGVEAFGSGSSLPFVILESNRIMDNSVQGTGTVTNQYSASAGVDLTGAEGRIVQNVIERDTVMGIVGALGGGLSVAFYTDGLWPACSIAGNIIRSNVCTCNQEASVGAGVVIDAAGDITMQDNLIEGNTALCSTGWAQGGGVCIAYAVSQNVLTNNRFLNNSVKCNMTNDGGGLMLFRSLSTITRCVFAGNVVAGSGSGSFGTPGGGAAISAYESSFRVENCIIRDNQSAVDGGGILISATPIAGTQQVIVNNTIVRNRASSHGGGLRLNYAPDVVAFNNILWNDSAGVSDPEIALTGSIAALAHSDVQGGYAGDGNISADPDFVAGDSMFHLTPTSPCIGRGADSIQLGTAWFYAPTRDCDGMPRHMPAGRQSVDMGAQEEQVTVGVGGMSHGLPLGFDLSQNYPNPFNPTTKIQFTIVNRQLTIVKVFDVLGREVTTLMDEVKGPGTYTVLFDASGLASGVYFYRLQAGAFVSTKKMVVLK